MGFLHPPDYTTCPQFKWGRPRAPVLIEAVSLKRDFFREGEVRGGLLRSFTERLILCDPLWGFYRGRQPECCAHSSTLHTHIWLSYWKGTDHQLCKSERDMTETEVGGFKPSRQSPFITVRTDESLHWLPDPVVRPRPLCLVSQNTPSLGSIKNSPNRSYS